MNLLVSLPKREKTGTADSDSGHTQNMPLQSRQWVWCTQILGTRALTKPEPAWLSGGRGQGGRGREQTKKTPELKLENPEENKGSLRVVCCSDLEGSAKANVLKAWSPACHQPWRCAAILVTGGMVLHTCSHYYELSVPTEV